MEIQNKVALVTGASTGIGEAIAAELLAQSASVCLASRSEARLKEAVSRINGRVPGASSRILIEVLDVTSDISCEQAIQAVKKKWGRLDILVNNAGYGLFGNAQDVPIEEAQSLFETNFFGAARMTKAAFPLLSQNSESYVVMVSSVASKRGIPWINYYCATKAAMNVFSESLRVEWGGYGIRVLVVMPGITESKFMQNVKCYSGIAIPSVKPRGQTTEEVACLTVQAIRKNKKEIITGLRNKLSVCARVSLSGLLEPMMARIFGPWDLKEDGARERRSEGAR